MESFSFRWAILNKRSKLFLFTIPLIVSFFGGAITTSAFPILKEIKANLDPLLTVDLNGEKLSFPPGSEPIKYNGQIYLPARKILDVVGLNSHIEYKQTTNTLIIGGPHYIDVTGKQVFYHLIINGNWNPSYLTPTKQ